MTFVTFDRESTAGQVEPAPTVRVDDAGRLVLNKPVWVFLANQYGPGWRLEVSLLFDEEQRCAGIRPLTQDEARQTPIGACWPTDTARSLEWPRLVAAESFVRHFQIRPGLFPALLVLGPGPRMVTFDVGPPYPRRRR